MPKIVLSPLDPELDKDEEVGDSIGLRVRHTVGPYRWLYIGESLEEVTK